ncbi:MAG: hypothetical protein H6672_09020 [Anaerolineaceae bacterium]|nr:hypothetical protein [Anaerolineaceae bacterium]
MSDDQQQNKAPDQSAPSNPFGSRFGSRSSTPPANQPQQQQPAPPPPRPSRPSGLLSRVGNRLDWRILPVTGTIIHFTLDGLGDPFHRILGKRLIVDFGKRDAVVKIFESGGADIDEIVSRLDISWKEYDLTGAILLYPWGDNLPNVMGGRLPAGKDDEDEDIHYAEDNRTPPSILRAVDPLLVLNILGRTRANILLPETPLVFEKTYLTLALMSDDPRLITLAQATGFVEESLVR